MNIDLETTVAFPDPRAPIIKRGAIERVIPVGSAGVRFFNREDAIWIATEIDTRARALARTDDFSSRTLRAN